MRRNQKKSKEPQIYPIQLSDHAAKDLVKRHAIKDFEESTFWHDRSAIYDYSATLHENGDVVLSVTYRSDNGFCMSSGSCLNKTIRPYDELTRLTIQEQKMIQMATDEYYRRQQEKAAIEIRSIREEMFGKT